MVERRHGGLTELIEEMKRIPGNRTSSLIVGYTTVKEDRVTRKTQLCKKIQLQSILIT